MARLLGLLILLVVGPPQTVPPTPGRCELTRQDATGLWTGPCGSIMGDAPSTMTASVAKSVSTGRWRPDAQPTLVLAAKLNGPAGTAEVEVEFYANAPGVIRTGAGWLHVVDVTETPTMLRFRIDDSARVQPSDLDRQIVERAARLLSSEVMWDRADDRQCAPGDKIWSIYCALELASREVTGGFHHRRPALAAVRGIVDERSAGRNYSHRLMDYNNDKTTLLSDVQSLFREALARMKR